MTFPTLPTRSNPGPHGHYVGMSVEERKVADARQSASRRGLPVYVSIVDRADGRDVEILDQEPTDSFIEELQESKASGAIDYFEIRVGNINGGDSTVVAWSER